MYRTLKSPISVQVEITQSCNHACRHCYNYFRHGDSNCLTMTSEQIDCITKELSKNEVFHVVLTGGEPLLVPKQSFKLAEELSLRGLSLALNSNMTLFNEDIGKRLREYNIRSILTSMIAADANIHDWVTQRPGSFSSLITAIKLAIKMDLKIVVNMVLTKWNFDQIRKTGDFVGQLGVKKFGITRACAPIPLREYFHDLQVTLDELRMSLEILYELQDKWGYDVDIFEHYPWCTLSDIKKYQYLSRRKCTAGITSATIGTDGQLRPCGHSSKKYGDVFSEGLTSPWLKMKDWRKRQFSGECLNCKYFKSCTGGCPTEAEGSPNGKDPYISSEKDVMNVPRESCDLIDIDTELMLANDLHFREESFGGIVRLDKDQTVMLDNESFSIIKGIDHGEIFTIRKICLRHGVVIADGQNIFSLMASRRLCIKKERG